MSDSFPKIDDGTVCAMIAEAVLAGAYHVLYREHENHPGLAKMAAKHSFHAAFMADIVGARGGSDE